MSFVWGPSLVPNAMQSDLIVAIGLAATALGAPIPLAVSNPEAIRVEVLRAGNGVYAQAGDRVTVHFVVRTRDGKELANSFKRGMPFTFELGEPSPFWETALDGVRVGGTSRLTANSSDFFGRNGVLPVIPPDTFFYADVKLLKVEKAMAPRPSEPVARIGQR